MAADARQDGWGPELIETIFALSTGAPPSAIGIVRISGPRADAALKALGVPSPEPRRAILAELRRDGDILDRAIVLRFPAPHSATGEDVVELHLHGGRAVVTAVLHTLEQIEGLRPALPGEFTRRAFENGRIDLAEAEGLADLLMAETQSQRRAAMALAGGALSRQVEEWRMRILALAARIEATLDFSDEGEVGEDLPMGWREELATTGAEIHALLARPGVERLREGVRVVIAGPPNSGKSSLLNALIGRDAAITSDIAGTTRDVLEAPAAIGGSPFLLIDTAGLRDSQDAIEAIGIAKARASLAGADLIFWLGPPEDAPERAIRVHAKADAIPAGPHSGIPVSARTGEGLDALIRLLIERSKDLLPLESETAINARHRVALLDCLDWLREAEAASDPILIAESLRQARLTLDRITGRAGVEDMLDTLFAKFCIGK